MERLKGRVAFVTGGGRGIGRAIALEFAHEGADVAVSARTVAELEAVAGDVRSLGRRALALRADAMNRDETQAAVRKVIAELGHLDILVNNAGGVLAPNGLAELQAFTHDDDLFVQNLMLNLVSSYWTIREVLPHMRDRRYGRIINVGSVFSQRSGGMMAYTTAKHGIAGLTRALATEVAPFGITVNCLCPGAVNTKLMDWDFYAAAYGVDAATVKAMMAANCVQNRILEPEEIAPMALTIAEERGGGAITGQLIGVDGGFRL